MRIELRPFDELGRFDGGWLSARYHFSFAGYHDPARMGHGALRVWNNDVIAPGTGFDMHAHRDMEIITYVLKGAITHTDHLGNRGRTPAGDVQVMSAGSGIMHAEHNLEEEPTELFQIWILPAERGVAPRWAQRHFPREAQEDRLVPLASGRAEHRGGALELFQDALVSGARLGAGTRVDHPLTINGRGYLVCAHGALEVEGREVGARDGVAIDETDSITIEATEEAEVILVEA